jgi:hypothetical protein
MRTRMRQGERNACDISADYGPRRYSINSGRGPAGVDDTERGRASSPVRFSIACPEWRRPGPGAHAAPSTPNCCDSGPAAECRPAGRERSHIGWPRRCDSPHLRVAAALPCPTPDAIAALPPFIRAAIGSASGFPVWRGYNCFTRILLGLRMLPAGVIAPGREALSANCSLSSPFRAHRRKDCAYSAYRRLPCRGPGSPARSKPD